MVTPEERAFMWELYAPEPRMRLNMGIRRRLAPLLDHDIGRIQVAHSILLTFIGSPFLYYGDEIGMGDNIWLNDRDGLRTPMQWDDGPNAGFSTAPKEQLTDPVIENGVYGYRKVNVKAQEADPRSLLNWIRTVLRTRKRHPAFGRGDLRFLPCENRAILAYLRSCGGEELLVVNNLSADRQTIELDLSDYVQRELVDAFSGRTLQAIGPGPYSLELERYAYRWLEIR
jgi:maltose alpha-D-glucosyltransferase/alpha-amylase